MGRVRVYAKQEQLAEGRKAKELLEANGFTSVRVVNLTEHPKKEKLLHTLLEKPETPALPAIFVNQTHIGTMSDLTALVEDKARVAELIQAAMKEDEDSKKKGRSKAPSRKKRPSPRTGIVMEGSDENVVTRGTGAPSSSSEPGDFSEPSADTDKEEGDGPSRHNASGTSEDEHRKNSLDSMLFEDEVEELDSLFDQIRSGALGIKKRDFGSFNKVKDCFKAFEVVMWLMTRLSIDEALAIKIGQKLKRYGFMHLAKEKEGNDDEPFYNSNDIYKFYADDDPRVLNMRRLWTRKRDPQAVVYDYIASLEEVVKGFSSPDKQSMDYTSLSKSDAFKKYVQCSLELQTLNIGRLSQEEIKALFLNIYFGLSVHAIATVGPPTTPVERAAFFDELSYVIGGQKYSLYDIKHGVLRSNRKPPGLTTRRFPKNDPRLNSVVKQYDPRCHFGLVCGTASCPPIQVYLPDTVDAQLEDNTKRFCMLTTSIFPDVKQIVIARVFGWFRDDFGETDQEVLRWLAPHLESPLDQELTAAIENEQYEVRCGQWNFETNNWTRPLDSNLEATGKDLDSELIRPSEGFRRELGTERRIGYEGFLNEASQNHDLNVYQAYFANNPHTNYLGKHPTEGVICVSVVSEKEQLPPPGSPAARKKSLTKAGGKKYRCLIRTKHGDSHAILAAPSQKELFDSLRSVYAFLDKKLLTQIDNPQFAKDLLSFEDDMMYTEFKFGVLYYRQGQVLEDDMFANVETSKEYEEFLELLGNKVELKGWNQYSAGLDTQRNQTGTHSLYTQWNDYEIMFHVATLLPYSKRDTQQIERKRHLGNDVVLIIFTDGTTPFNPQCINSKYNQIHVVVQAVKEGDEVLYRVAVASREDVPAYAPSLPNPAIFPKGPKLREFLLKKMINGLKASFKSPSFAKKIERSRHLALEEYAKKYL